LIKLVVHVSILVWGVAIDEVAGVVCADALRELEALQDLTELNHKLNCKMLLLNVGVVSDLFNNSVFKAITLQGRTSCNVGELLLFKEVVNNVSVILHNDLVDDVYRCVFYVSGQNGVFKVLEAIVYVDALLNCDVLEVCSISGALSW
jgi:hypothetical protein